MAAKGKYFSDMQKQELEDSTNCCICEDNYKCPKLLPCGHTFCMNCIQETGLNTSKGPGDEMPCPICRRQFRIPSEGFTKLHNNYYVEGLIRVAQILDPSLASSIACDSCLEESQEETGKVVQRADIYCSDCKQKLCEECCKYHGKFKSTKNHKLLSINGQHPTDEDLIQSLVPIVCDLHKKEDLRIYCCPCKTLVCDICFTEYHEGHKGTHVTKAVDEFRKEIANNIAKVKTFLGEAEMKKSEFTMSKQYVHERFGSLECDIISRRDGLKQVTDKHATELLEELSLLRQSIMTEIHMETDDIDAQLARLESYNSYCKKIMTKGSACDICRSVGDLSARVNELQEENKSLAERQLKPLSLCFIRTELEDEDENNMIGQLREQYHSKQKTKTKQRLIEELKIEIDNLKAEVQNKETDNEVLKLANEYLKRNLDKDEQANNFSKLRRELEKEQLINKTLQSQVENLTAELKQEKMATTPLQSDTDKLVAEGKSGCLKIEEKTQLRLNEFGDDRADQNRNMEKPEFHKFNPDGNSNLKSGDEDSKSENMNNAEKQKNRQRNLIEKNAKYQESTNSSGRQENQATGLEHDRICALKVLPSVDIDEDIFYFLNRHRSHELSRISEKCNVFEQYEVGQGHKLALGVNPYHDTDSVMAEFRKLYDQTTFYFVKIPEGVDIENLINVAAITELKGVELGIMRENRVCKIVGSHIEIITARKKMLDVIASEMNQGCEAATNRKDQLNVEMTITAKDKESSRCVQWHPAPTTIHQARRSVFKVLKQGHNSLQLSASNSLTIEVKHDDLSKMSNIDVLVSCLNHQLDVDNLLVEHIFGSVGTDVKKELATHTSRLEFLNPGYLVHTGPRPLGGVKVIIYVVRPELFEFPLSEQKSRDTLRNVFTNCLRYTNDKLRFNSICLRPIGLDLFGPEMVVDCFLDAVEMFASTVDSSSPADQHLNCIHLISHDFNCMIPMIQYMKQLLGVY